MIKLVLPFIVFFVIVSCQSTTKKPYKSNGQTHGKVKKKEMTPFKNTDNALRDFDKRNISKTRTTAEGITIKWFQEAFKKNPNLKAGEVYLINYRVSMPDGKIFDGNNKIKIPFWRKLCNSQHRIQATRLSYIANIDRTRCIF